MNGNAAEVLELYQKNFILNIEPNKLKEILQIDSNKWDILFGSETVSNLSANTSWCLFVSKLLISINIYQG